jgi:CheY-like chemotaxis protein
MLIFRRVRVLVVGDDTDACEMLRRVLEECKATVDTATSVSQALERLDRKVHDIIISDIGMPEIDGYELYSQVAVSRCDDSSSRRDGFCPFRGPNSRLTGGLEHARCQAT